jgi:dienelactone hydrolase
VIRQGMSIRTTISRASCRWACFASLAASFVALLVASSAVAQTSSKVIDIPTRNGVTERVLYLAPMHPKATLVLFAGGAGILRIGPEGAFGWGQGNFVVRTRQRFVDEGVAVMVVDAPSDRLKAPYLDGFRFTPEHVTDIRALVAWARANGHGPVWLVGTSRGTQSVAHAATLLQGAEGPDGIVLTSTIVSDPDEPPVPAMALPDIHVPVLVVHHERDACDYCPYALVVPMMAKLTGTSRKQLLSYRDGTNDDGPCEAFAYHGFNGIEPAVVHEIVGWILAN